MSEVMINIAVAFIAMISIRHRQIVLRVNSACNGLIFSYQFNLYNSNLVLTNEYTGNRACSSSKLLTNKDFTTACISGLLTDLTYH